MKTPSHSDDEDSSIPFISCATISSSITQPLCTCFAEAAHIKGEAKCWLLCNPLITCTCYRINTDSNVSDHPSGRKTFQLVFLIYELS